MTLTYTPVPAAPAQPPGPAEAEDVTLALGVSREINRIYSGYLRNELTATDPLRTALRLTAGVLETLQATVGPGVGARRIEVAAAQTREMLAVLFAVPSAGAGPTRPQLGPESPRRSCRSEDAEHPGVTTRPGGVGPAPPSGQASPVPVRRRTVVRLVLGLLGYCLLGVLVDVPIAILALFPAEWVPLTAAFTGAPLFVSLLALRRRLKTPQPDPLGAAAPHADGRLDRFIMPSE